MSQRLRFRRVHHQLPLFEHHHPFYQFMYRHAVSGNHQSAIAEPLSQPLNKLSFGMLIQRGGGLIKQDDIGRTQQHAGEHDGLPLTAG